MIDNEKETVSYWAIAKESNVEKKMFVQNERDNMIPQA